MSLFLDISQNGAYEWTALAYDDQQDTITIDDIQVSEIGGVATTTDAQRYPDWLVYTASGSSNPDDTVTSNLNGRYELAINFALDADQFPTVGNEDTYTVQVQVSAAGDTTTATFDVILGSNRIIFSNTDYWRTAHGFIIHS